MFLDTQPASFGGDGQLDALAQFRVDHPGEIAMLLKQIAEGALPVNLSGPQGGSMTTEIWTVDRDHRRVVFNTDALNPHLQAMVDGGEITGVCYLDAVKLQFELRNPMLVHGARTTTLQATMPSELYRFQRRASYRVRTLERSSPTAHLRHPAIPDMKLALRVLDVSIGGCAIFLPEDVPPLAPGVTVHGVRVELDGDTRFGASLLLHHVSAILPGSRGVRLGCEWVQLDGPSERALQRYIDQTQKRRRLLTLD